MKTASIVLPTYQGARYLRESVESCLAQTYRHIELIVVDDCSTDGTQAILEDYSTDPRVTVVRHSANRGLPAALNTGFAHAAGEYLSWTSDDNLYSPEAVERMVSYLEEQQGAGFVYCDYWLVDENGETIRRVAAGPPDHLREACRLACFLYRREVRDAVGEYDTSLFGIEDYDYWLRVAQRFRMEWLPQPLYRYRRHAASLTARDNLKRRARMFDEVQTRHVGPDPARYRRTLAGFYAANAFEHHLAGRRTGVLKYGAAAVLRKPSLLGNRGLWSIAAQAALGRGMAGALKRVARAGRCAY